MATKLVLHIIRERYPFLTKSQKKVGDYIVKNLKQVAFMSTLDIASQLKLSDATIIRFARNIGFNGYPELRDTIKREISYYDSPDERISRMQDIDPHTDNSAMNVARNDIRSQKKFYDNLDFDLIDSVVSDIYAADVIHLIGIGTDRIIALFLEWNLKVMGFNVICYTESGFNLATKITRLNKNDLIIMGTNPRHLKDEKNLLENAHRIGVKTVGITTMEPSELTHLFDTVLAVDVKPHYFINSYVTYMSLCNIILIKTFERNNEQIMERVKDYSDFVNSFDFRI